MRGQAGLEAMVSSAALIAFIAVLLFAVRGISGGARESADAVHAQSLADSMALSVNFRAADSAFTSLGGFKLPAGCKAEGGAVECTAMGSERRGRIYGGAWWDGYGGFNRIPI